MADDLTELKRLALTALSAMPMDDFERRVYLSVAHPQAVLGLLARIEQAEQDAARYRWLRECSIVRSDRTMYVQHNRYRNGAFLRMEYPSHDELDAIIDAALSPPGAAATGGAGAAAVSKEAGRLDPNLEAAKAEVRTLRNAIANEGERIERLEAALRELVACKDLHDAIAAQDCIEFAFHMQGEYNERKPKAWTAARALCNADT